VTDCGKLQQYTICALGEKRTCSILWFVSDCTEDMLVISAPLPSNRRHLSCDDCLEG